MAHSTSVLAYTHFGMLATFRNIEIVRSVELPRSLSLCWSCLKWLLYKSGTQGEFVLVFNFRHPFAWNLGEISKASWLLFTPMQT